MCDRFIFRVWTEFLSLWCGVGYWQTLVYILISSIQIIMLYSQFVFIFDVGSLQWKGTCYRWNNHPDDQCFKAIPADLATWFSCINIFQLATTAAASATVHLIHIVCLFDLVAARFRLLFKEKKIWFHHCCCQPIRCVKYFLGEFSCECVARFKEMEVAISYGFDVECILSCIQIWFWDVTRQRCKGNCEISCWLCWTDGASVLVKRVIIFCDVRLLVCFTLMLLLVVLCLLQFAPVKEINSGT